MTVRSVITVLQAHATAAGAAEAPVDPTETNAQWPFSVCYLAQAQIVGEAGMGEQDMVTVFLDVHVNRVDLPTDIQKVLTFYEAFKARIIGDPTLGGTVDTVRMGRESPLLVSFGEMSYANVKTVGLRWTITFKQRM